VRLLQREDLTLPVRVPLLPEQGSPLILHRPADVAVGRTDSVDPVIEPGGIEIGEGELLRVVRLAVFRSELQVFPREDAAVEVAPDASDFDVLVAGNHDGRRRWCGWRRCRHPWRNLRDPRLRRRDRQAGVESHRRAVALEPRYTAAYQGLMAAYGELGRMDEALGFQRQRVELDPSSAATHSDLLTTMLFTESPQDLLEAHKGWEARHAPSRQIPHRDWQNERQLAKRLRIAYLSPDFRNHPVPRYMIPILARHDRKAVEVFCYSDAAHGDETTECVRGHADVWRQIAGLPNHVVRQQMQDDRIDILVDLTGHMDNPRTLLLAERAAPVQVAYCGYPFTTGISEVDYRITDAEVDPLGTSEPFYTEELIRVPGCCWCLEPEDSPEVGLLPQTKKGYVTFAVLNRLAKVRPRMIQLWAQILKSVKGSRLMVLVARHVPGSNDPAK
jgi:predicted O-linked N-acetylglucosamine transferase (SPINDLY family)